MATQRELAEQAQRLWEQARNHLIQTLQPGNRYAAAQGTPTAYSEYRPLAGMGGPQQGQTFQNGRMPSDAEITAQVERLPAYRAIMRKMEKSAKGGGSKGPGRGGPPTAPQADAQGQPSQAMAAYQAWLAQQQAGFDEAKAANEGRYNEGHGELTGVRDFRQEKYANFGEAASQDIDERMQEALKNARANAQRRGLSNSNVTDAYALRAARDTAREQQRVRETRDTRMADAYAQDTGNLVGFVERREDPYPDMNQAMQIGIQLGNSEADRQAQVARLAALQQYAGDRGDSGRGRGDYRLPLLPGPQGGVSPIFMNGTPVQQGLAFLGSQGGRGPAYTSNRYPTRRSPEEYAALRQAQQRQAALSPPVAMPGQLPDGWTGNATMQPTLAPAPRPPQYLPPGWTGASTMAPSTYNNPYMRF